MSRYLRESTEDWRLPHHGSPTCRLRSLDRSRCVGRLPRLGHPLTPSAESGRTRPPWSSGFPPACKCPSASGCGCRRYDERGDLASELSKVLGQRGFADSSRKGTPLLHMVRRLEIGGGEARRRIPGHSRRSTLERSCNCLRQRRAIKGEVARECPEVVEVLHTTVRRVELDHCVKLLRDGRLDRHGTQPHARLTQQRRILDEARPGNDRIPYPKVDLKVQADIAHAAGEPQTRPEILSVLRDVLGDDACGIEGHAVRLVFHHR